MFYGLLLSVTSLGGNDYLDFFISGAVELPAYLLCLVTVSRYGRPRPLAASLTLAGSVLVVTVAIPQSNEKSARRRREHCAPVAVRRSQKFRPAADPLPGGAGWPKFNQLEMVTTFTYKPSLVRIDARNFQLSC